MTFPDDECRRCQRREDNLEAEIGAAWEALPDDVADAELKLLRVASPKYLPMPKIA